MLSEQTAAILGVGVVVALVLVSCVAVAIFLRRTQGIADFDELACRLKRSADGDDVNDLWPVGRCVVPDEARRIRLRRFLAWDGRMLPGIIILSAVATRDASFLIYLRHCLVGLIAYATIRPFVVLLVTRDMPRDRDALACRTLRRSP